MIFRNRFVIAYLAWTLFLMVIISSAASPGSPLQLDPQRLLINGTQGTDVFQASINATAKYCNITYLNLTPSNLRMTAPQTPWAPQFLISSADIQINPNIKTIVKGQTNEYLMRIQNIPRSGRYNGSLSISYNLPNGTIKKESFPISLMAYKFNASPIFLKFDKSSFLGLISGSKPQSRDIEITDESAQVSRDATNYLKGNLCATLEEMVNVDDKSNRFKRLDCFQMEKQPELKNGSNSTIILHAKFMNPEVDAGKYTGVLTINSKNPLWPIISIPVEMRIRLMPPWLAFILIFIGVSIYYIITYRKKDVKDRLLREHEITNIAKNIKIIRDFDKWEIQDASNVSIEKFEYMRDFNKTINTSIFQNPLKWNHSWNELDSTWNEIEEAYRNVEGVPSRLSKEKVQSIKESPTERFEVISKNLLYSKMKRIRDVIFALISILLATIIGYLQLYADNPMFGAGHSPIYEYLALLLWGFGVEAGAAKVTDIIDLLGLSRGSNQEAQIRTGK